MNKELMLNKPEPGKIIEALHVLQDTCNSYSFDATNHGYVPCYKCPLATEAPSGMYICKIKNSFPSDWSIEDAPDDIWRAFK